VWVGAVVVYFPIAEVPRCRSYVVVKTGGNRLAFVPAVRHAVYSLDQNHPIDDIQTPTATLGSIAR